MVAFQDVDVIGVGNPLEEMDVGGDSCTVFCDCMHVCVYVCVCVCMHVWLI